MAFPTDLADVVAGGNITASRNNAITNKIGIDSSSVVTSLDYLIKNTGSKLGKIASLAAASNYLVGDGALVGANWGVKSSSEVVTDLGLVIGTNVQAYNAVLTNLSNPSPSATDKYLTFVGSNYDAVTTAEVRADIFDLGSDATGDVFYRNASGILTRLGVGSADEVLTLAGSPALPTWAAAGGGSSAFTDPVTITDDDSDPLLIITQSGSNTGLLQLAQGAHTLTWTKSGNSFLLSHSSGSASIKLQDNSAVVMGGTLQMGTATATGIGFGSHGGIYGYGGSRIHIYPQSGQPLIIGSNTTSQTGLEVFFEAIPVNFLVTTSITVNDAGSALTINQSGAGDALTIQNAGAEVFRFDQDTGDLIWHNAASECITFSQSGAGSYMIIKKAAASLMTLSPVVQFHSGLSVNSGLAANTLQFGSQADCNGGMRLRGTGDNGWGDHVLFDQNYELTTIATAAYTDSSITIPANSILLSVTGRVNSQPGGTSTVDVGVSGATTRFGTGVSTAATTQFEFSGLFGMYTSATAIRFTPNTTPSGTGSIRVSITYITLVAPTS